MYKFNRFNNMRVVNYLVRVLIVLLLLPAFLIGIVATIAIVPFIVLIGLICMLAGDWALTSRDWKELLNKIKSDKESNLIMEDEKDED